jgi:DNA-binding transcriptional LysR family regulator
LAKLASFSRGRRAPPVSVDTRIRMALNIKYRSLKAFLLAAEVGSFTIGANILGITQPSFSALIQNLEDDLNLKLFERHTRSIALTSVGMELRDRILRPITDLEEAYRNMTDLAAVRRGMVVVGALPSTSLTLVPPTLNTLGATHPALEVRVIEAYNDQLVEMLRTNQVEFAIASQTDEAPELAFELLTDDTFCVVYPPGNTIDSLDKVLWNDLVQQKLILLGRGSSIRRQFDRAIHLEAMPAVLHYDVTHMTTAVILVKQGLGITILPHLPLRALPIHGLRYKLIDEDTARRRIGVLYRRDRHLSPGSRIFIESLKKVVGAGDSYADERLA